MFQNDISFVNVDIQLPCPDLTEIVRDLITRHGQESVASPFFYRSELESLEEELPSGWKVGIRAGSEVPSDKIRITVFNAYFEAVRYYDETVAGVSLVGEDIGGDIIAITEISSTQNSELSLLDLDSASGSSAVTLCITPGASFASDSEDFSVDNLDQAVEFIKRLEESILADDLSEDEDEWFSAQDAIGLTMSSPPLTGADLIEYMQSAGDKPQHVLCFEAGYIIEGEDGKWMGDMGSLMMAMM